MGMINLDRGGSSDLGGLTDGRPSDWKFVIIDTADTRYLVLGPVSKYRYHAGIVNRFCELRGVACHTVKKPALVEILDKAVTVRGGGRVRFDEALKTLVFFDTSSAYGGFSERDLREILHAVKLFDGMAVRIVRS